MANFYKNRITFENIVIIFAPILIIFIRKILLSLGVKEVCLWKLLTGHECIGCGMMTAMWYLLQGKFELAYATNHLVVIVAPVLLCIWLSYVFKVIKGINTGEG